MKNNNIISKKCKRVLAIVLCVIMSVFVLTITGCDDDDSYEVRLEEARMHIDARNYTAARTILESLSQTNDVKILLSNCILGGELNMDLFNVISAIEALDPDEAGSIDIVGTLIGGDDEVLTSGELDDKIDAAGEAITLLAVDIGVDNLTPDQKLQLGLLSMTHTSLLVGKIVWVKLGLDSDDAVPMTESEIATAIAATPTTADDIPADTITQINTNVTYLEATIDVLGATNSDLIDDFEAFKSDIGSASEGEGVTAVDLSGYINGLGA